MKRLLKEYFTFNKRDRNGILVLLLGIAGTLTLTYCYPIVVPAETTNLMSFKTEITPIKAQILANQERAKQEWEARYKQKDNYWKNKKNTNVDIVLFDFDPNELTFEQAQQLGFSKRVAKTITNYLNKGGKFYKKTDLKKIYGVKVSDYERLEPYIVLKTKQKNKSKWRDEGEYTNDLPIVLANFDPNELDIEQAQQLGLSKKVAKTITNYLNKGGKFYKKADFKKIYGISDADYERLEPYIILKTKEKTNPKEADSATEKVEEVVALFNFNPNELDISQAQQLGLSKKVAKTITNYLNKGGKFYKKADFKKIYGISDADYERLEPYIILKTKEKTNPKEVDSAIEKVEEVVALFDFDPNELDVAQAQQLGLSKKVAKTITNYLSKGGKFYKKADFKKIYGISDIDYKRLAPYIKIAKTKTYPSKKEDVIAKKPAKPAPETFAFNPNTLTQEEAQRLGFSKKQASSIIKYIQNGGKFRQKEDFGKLRVVSESIYQRLENYIDIPVEVASASTPTKEKIPSPSKKEDTYANITIDINMADETEWQKLRGIGPKFASRIVKYRGLLGGFHHKEQLKEVYGLDEERYALISKYLQTNDKTSFFQININKADIDALKKHPYIDYKVAKSIIAIRKQHGEYGAVADIKKSFLIDEALYTKIAPYLKIK